MTKDQLRAHLQAMDEDTLWNTLCTNTPGGMDCSIMSTEEMIEYGVNHWQEDEGLRRATPQEIRAAGVIHGEADIEIDDDALCAEGTEGVWVAAWVWVSNNNIKEYGDE